MQTTGREDDDLAARLASYGELTRTFPALLGLRMVPLGAWFLLLPALGPFEPTIVQLAALATAVVATGMVDGWYRRRYGRVEPARLRLGRGRPLLAGLLAATLAFAAAGVGRLASNALFVALLVVVLFAAAVLFGWPRLVAGKRPAGMVVLGALAVLAGAALAVASRDAVWFAATGDLFSVFLGAFLCLAGALEHHALVCSFSPHGGDG